MSVIMWLLVPLAVTAVTAGSRHRNGGPRRRPAPRELVRRALAVMPASDDQRAQLRAISRVLDTDPRVDVLVVEWSTSAAAGVDELSPRVTVLRQPDAASETEALQIGAARALTHGYDAVIQLSVRHSRLARRITALLEALDDGAHVSVGSRYIPGGRVVGCSYGRRVLSRTANAALRWLTDGPANDMTAPVRVYRREAIQRVLLPATGADQALGVDIMLRCRETGMHVAEVPVTVAGPAGAAMTPAGGRAVLARAVRSRRGVAAPAPALVDLTGPAPASSGR